MCWTQQQIDAYLIAHTRAQLGLDDNTTEGADHEGYEQGDPVRAQVDPALA